MAKAPRKISARYIENAALHYLQRYASSEANLRRVLIRKIKRSCKHHDTEAEPFFPVVDDLIRKYAANGLLNDQGYAETKTAALRRGGKSARAIHAKLRLKGLSADIIEDAINSVDTAENAEFLAALTLTRKKKIGRHRKDDIADDPILQKKELAILARAGFSYAIAQKALDYVGEDP